MLRRVLVAAAAVLALASCGATAKTNKAVVAHKLIVAVKAEQKLAVLVLLTQNGRAPGGAVATPGKPLTIVLNNSGLYRLKAEINSSCTGSCAASYRISGSANHKLEIVPSCQPKGSGFVCSTIKIVKVY